MKLFEFEAKSILRKYGSLQRLQIKKVTFCVAWYKDSDPVAQQPKGWKLDDTSNQAIVFLSLEGGLRISELVNLEDALPRGSYRIGIGFPRRYP